MRTPPSIDRRTFSTWLLAGSAGPLAACDPGGLKGMGGDAAAVPEANEAESAPPVPAVKPGETLAMAKSLGRGINFGNALEAPRENAWGVPISPELFDVARDIGVQTIRLPVRWSNHALAKAPYTIDPAFFERVDFAVEQTLQRKMKLVLNMHHYRQLDGQATDGRKDKSFHLDKDEFAVEPALLHERFKAMWAQIAERYKSLPRETVLFQIYNEPNYALTPSIWNELAADTLAVIRRSNPERFLVVPSINWLPSLAKLQLPEADPRLIVDVHNYQTIAFTHQQLQWMDPVPPAMPFDRKVQDKILEELDVMAEWVKAHRRPIWIGEFGVSIGTDPKERAAYARFNRDAMESRGFSWAYWDLAGEFAVYDPKARRFYPGMRDALFGA